MCGLLVWTLHLSTNLCLLAWSPLSGETLELVYVPQPSISLPTTEILKLRYHQY